ncbi:hypothetical protein [Pseudonocardia sp. MH-G8]|uniref:hypothetical protein n=1 Tax=Pseudonocardia sp. MH-G8 TaxID=1854588 RepID=UPI000B9FA72D|nr:hypothetical protein [Pseudonocardia sp. MH-G8]OZM79083.1 hypothetical protein CFP66_27545 [Pseudonocardia sp. MH-G8]
MYLALLHEVHDLPADSPTLNCSGVAGEVGARVDLLVRAVLGAVGGGHDAIGALTRQPAAEGGSVRH